MSSNVSNALKNKCRLYNFNSKMGIKYTLGIPDEIDLNNLREEILKCYQFFYLRKPIKIEESKQQRIKRYLNPSTINEIYNTVPEDYSRDKYRMLIDIKKEKSWLKKTLKKINKYLSSSLIERIRLSNRKIRINYDIEYLHSSMRKRSYETNAKKHKGNKYVLAIDIQNFYPSIKEHKVYSFFRKTMNLDSDIATIYTILCTCPLDDPKVKSDFEFGLGQGLATSPILAYMINYKMFDYIYMKAKANNIDMTVYVDDVVFSSDKPISQKFIDSLFSIIEQNGMNIKRKKVHSYGNNQTKKITGIFLTSTDRVRVSNSKHEELFYQYQFLVNNINKIKNIDDYFNIFNLYIKFNGNVQFVKLVEGKTLRKYDCFIDKYKKCFPNGVKKIRKNDIYKKDNLDSENYNIIIGYYNSLKK